jgi:CBS domain-containing protein
MNPTTAEILPRLDQIPVERVMHTGIVSCDPSVPLPAIARIFAEERIHCVVVNGIERTRVGERMTWGIISDHDLMRALDAGDGGATAGALAVAGLITVDRTETLDRVIQLMAAYDVTHVVVVDRAYPVGIVSALDVAAAAGDV